MEHTWKMHTKILLLCLGVTFFALLLQTWLFQATSSEMIYGHAKTEHFHLMENMQDEVYSSVKSLESILGKLYNEQEFIQDLKTDTLVKEMREKHFRETYNFVTTNFETSDNVVSFYLYNSQNEIISTYRRAVTPKHNYPLDIYDEGFSCNSEVVREYVESDNPVTLISGYYNTYRGKNIIRIVMKIYNVGYLRDKIGYVVCDIDSKNFIDIMKKYNISDDMYLWIQPTGDQPILCLGELAEDGAKEVEEFQGNIRKGEEEASIIELGERVFFHVEQNKYNLDAYSLMPQELLYENQKVLVRNLLVIVLTMLFVSMTVAYLVSKTLTKPLERMANTAWRIKEGERTLRMEGLKDDEIGQLGQNFNEMLDTVEELISREYEAKLLLNQAEYHALQAQINPHFLYNTLDTMSSIAEMQDCGQVSELCRSLSDIFRYSLDMKHPFSNVGKEMMHLKNYIYVMDVRMRGHINYRFEIEDEVLKDVIPRLSIQPIVENALNHGLRNSRGAKEVRICAKVQEGNLLIEVRDNGVGMTAEKIGQLLQAENTNENEARSSIGIHNINMRLKMLYGEEYGVSILSEVGEGTCVTLNIPRRSEEEVKHGNL